MSICKWGNLLLLTATLLACTKEKRSLNNFDAKAWTADKNGCNNQRSSMIRSVLAQKDALLGLDEMEIVDVLGKPDQNELYKRNQKFYYYAVEPAASCPTSGESHHKLVIRFNAMGLAKEILVE